MEFFAYTDGSCKGNPGKGGYAFIVYDEMGEAWVSSSGSEKETTNNKMELTAAIEALRVLIKFYQNFNVKIYSDSSYLVNCFNDGWIERWRKNGWKTNKKEEVLNQEYWEILDDLVKKTGAMFEKVPRNDAKIKFVDREAKKAANSL